MNEKQIKNQYNVADNLIVKYLARIKPENNYDFADYEHRKNVLRKLCNSSVEFEKASRCLAAILGI